ncbi:MAG TPA: hypothetical protein PLO61_10095 [Fimbriimonadaceae bacterium]|nr:hypothetical protein [Fimbriimonadaceae bacterium]HRJ33944.1 hypothetical protein [Fimbriimonadaceae bacterium]
MKLKLTWIGIAFVGTSIFAGALLTGCAAPEKAGAGEPVAVVRGEKSGDQAVTMNQDPNVSTEKQFPKPLAGKDQMVPEGGRSTSASAQTSTATKNPGAGSAAQPNANARAEATHRSEAENSATSSQGGGNSSASASSETAASQGMDPSVSAQAGPSAGPTASSAAAGNARPGAPAGRGTAPAPPKGVAKPSRAEALSNVDQVGLPAYPGSTNLKGADPATKVQTARGSIFSFMRESNDPASKVVSFYQSRLTGAQVQGPTKGTTFIRGKTAQGHEALVAVTTMSGKVRINVAVTKR